MEPELRFHTIVVAVTVVVMFLAIVFLSPAIQPLSTSVKSLGAVIAMLASIGTYRGLAMMVSMLLRRSRWLREKLLGDYYLEGTWVGFFVGQADDVRFVVEHFRQSLTSIVIQGNSYSDDGRSHANWVTEATHFDARRGTLFYSYTCNILSRHVPHEGIALFNVQRPSTNESANSIEGYVADLVDGDRQPVREIKVSTEFLDRQTAIQKAREFAILEGVLPKGC